RVRLGYPDPGPAQGASRLRESPSPRDRRRRAGVQGRQGRRLEAAQPHDDRTEGKTMSLSAAYNRYWSAKNHAEHQAAHYEILLKGGRDGYPNVGPFRQWIARKLRALATWVDKFE